MSQDTKDTKKSGTVKPWRAPHLKHVGDLGEVLQGGGGKLSTSGGDPGEMRVEKPHGG